jgi:hypothetical protein
VAAEDGSDGDPSHRWPSRRHLGSGSGVQVVGGDGAGATIPSGGGRLLSGEPHPSYPSSLLSLVYGFLIRY